jgi:hypothetical protein
LTFIRSLACRKDTRCRFFNDERFNRGAFFYCPAFPGNYCLPRYGRKLQIRNPIIRGFNYSEEEIDAAGRSYLEPGKVISIIRLRLDRQLGSTKRPRLQSTDPMPPHNICKHFVSSFF